MKSKAILPVLLLSFLPWAAVAQVPPGGNTAGPADLPGAVLTERRVSFELSKVWIWYEDGKVMVQGEMDPLFEMEQVQLAVTPSKFEGKKPEKGAWMGTIGEPIPVQAELTGDLPVLVRVNYRKLDRIQTKRNFTRVKVKEVPTEGGAVLVQCRLGGDEEVRCAQEAHDFRPDPVVVAAESEGDSEG